MSETRIDRLRDELAEMTRQRDELRKTLVNLCDWVDEYQRVWPEQLPKRLREHVSAAMKATEEK